MKRVETYLAEIQRKEHLASMKVRRKKMLFVLRPRVEPTCIQINGETI